VTKDRGCEIKARWVIAPCVVTAASWWHEVAVFRHTAAHFQQIYLLVLKIASLLRNYLKMEISSPKCCTCER